ncbi:MAG: adenosylmethionine decarboxylase [bacterium]|nr:adenosylmethionine decarboxylase [bacterium]
MNAPKQIKLKRSYKIGREIIADLKGCDPRVIDDVDLLKRLVQEAIRTTKHHLLDLSARKFQPVGVTVVGILAESHISLHTYPEIGYVAVDVFTCGANKPEPILEYLQEKFGAKEMYWEYIRRGTMRQWRPILEMDGYRRQIEVTKLIHRRVTPYQTLEVVKAKMLGTCLFANNVLQMSTVDADIYDRQMLKELGKAEKVLIVGGGDCSILRNLVKNKHLKEIYMLEQDQQVTEVAKKYLGASRALKDPRLKMFYGDALESIPYLSGKGIDYAVVDIISLSDGRAKGFYEKIFNKLWQIGVPRWSSQGGHVTSNAQSKIISEAAEEYYKEVKEEEKYFFSGGMWRFIYGGGRKTKT